MKLKCIDGNIREFITAYELLVSHGFDPVFLEEDQYLVQLSFPPGYSIIRTWNLAKLGITPENCFWHWGWRHRKINPCHITLPNLLKNVEWVALHNSLMYKKETDIGGKLSLFTRIIRTATLVWDFISLNKKNRYSLKNLIIGLNDFEKFEFLTGHEYLGYQHVPTHSQSYLYIKGLNENNYLLDPSLLGYTKHIYLSIKQN